MNNIGGILGKTTLHELLNNNSLKITKDGTEMSFEDLRLSGAIDETSININIGKLYRLDPALKSINIKGKYVIGENFQEVIPDADGGILIEPHEHLLGITLEKVKIPENAVGEISERRTVAGNLGIEIEGHIPPGLQLDNVTFRLKNNTDRSFKIYVGEPSPMKITFQSLSSHESYGSNRNAKVEDSSHFASGYGDPNYTMSETIQYTIHFDRNALEGEKHNFKLNVFNDTKATLNQLTVIPTLVTEKFKFTSFSHGWKFYENTDPANKCSYCKDGQSCEHKISYILPIKAGENKEFNFEIKFTQAIPATQFKVELNYASDDTGIKVKDNSEANTLTVQSRKSWLIHKFKDRLFDAVIIAAFILLLENWLFIPKFIKWAYETFFQTK